MRGTSATLSSLNWEALHWGLDPTSPCSPLLHSERKDGQVLTLDGPSGPNPLQQAAQEQREPSQRRGQVRDWRQRHLLYLPWHYGSPISSAVAAAALAYLSTCALSGQNRVARSGHGCFHLTAPLPVCNTHALTHALVGPYRGEAWNQQGPLTVTEKKRGRTSHHLSSLHCLPFSGWYKRKSLGLLAPSSSPCHQNRVHRSAACMLALSLGLKSFQTHRASQLLLDGPAGLVLALPRRPRGRGQAGHWRQPRPCLATTTLPALVGEEATAALLP